jgi:hypothetical protein
MKKLLSLSLSAAFALMALQATASPIPMIHGPLTINWAISQQKLDSATQYPGLGKTNITGKGFEMATNVLQIYHSSFTTMPFVNTQLLDLLENSLKTTFPAGTKLETDGGNLYVTDSTGTNEIVSVTNVLTVESTNQVSTGVSTRTTTTKNLGVTTGSGSGSGSGSQIIIVKYDDSALTTTDGTVTRFTFVGESSSSDSDSYTLSNSIVSSTITYTLKESGTFTVHGVGYGEIRGVSSIIQGTLLGTPAGTEIIKE